jgi:hypothetical protein
MSALETDCRRAFARHETFHARYGWFRKAVVAAADDPHIFTADDATVTLGVGKNMVRAIRYWGEAAKVITDLPPENSKRRGSAVGVTRNGQAILSTAGADPFLEAPGTLWLLHWWMLSPPCDLPAWWLAFHRFPAVEFSELELVDFINEEVARSAWSAPHESSVQKDVSCLLRTFATVDATGRTTLDDLLDSPFRALGLLERSQEGKGRFRFLLGPKPSLPDELVTHAVLDWMARRGSARTVSTANATHETGSPGKAFRLSERVLTDSVGKVADRLHLGAVKIAAGSTQFALTAHMTAGEAAALALGAYYKGLRMRLNSPLGHDAVAVSRLVSA